MIKLDNVNILNEKVQSVNFRVKPNKQVGWVQCSIIATSKKGIDFITYTTNKVYTPLNDILDNITNENDIIDILFISQLLNDLSFTGDDE